MLEANNNQPFEQPMSIRAVDSQDYVSVIIPCYNEERFIGKALEQLADQFEPDRYELVIVDGLSEDRSREVIDEFCKHRPDVNVLLVDNPARNIPTALNLGIAAAATLTDEQMSFHHSQGQISPSKRVAFVK